MTEYILTMTVTMKPGVAGHIIADNIVDEVGAKLDRLDIEHEIDFHLALRAPETSLADLDMRDRNLRRVT